MTGPDRRGLECEWKVRQGAVSGEWWSWWLAAVKVHWWADGLVGRVDAIRGDGVQNEAFGAYGEAKLKCMCSRVGMYAG